MHNSIKQLLHGDTSWDLSTHPNPKEIPYIGYHLTSLAQFHFSMSHVDILLILLQLYATMTLHSSHITNFHIIQAVYTFS